MAREHGKKRTNGRSPWAGALRLGLGVAGAVAPAFAGRAAASLFLTPPRHPQPPREREALAQGEPFEVRLGPDRLRCWRFGDGPTVLLVHGWGGRGGQMGPLALALRDAGWSPVVFDGPAHGASGGKVASVPHFARAIAALARHVGARAAIGHSMGAAGLAMALVGGFRLEAAVFLAPPRSPATFFALFCEAMALEGPVREAARRRLEQRVGIDVESLDLPRLTGAVETPLLVVHDRGDAEVPWTDGAAIVEAWRGARLLSTEGLGHRRILRDPGVAGETAAFLEAQLRPAAPAAAAGRW